MSLSISLKHHGGGVFLRSKPSELFAIEDVRRRESMILYVKKHTEEEASVAAEYKQSFRDAYQFDYDPEEMEPVRVVPVSMWNEQKKMFVTKELDSFNGFAQFRMLREGHDFVVACGFTSQEGEWICIASSTDKNRGIYNAAMSGNLNAMRVLAIWANANANQKIWVNWLSKILGTPRARMRIPDPDGELVLHIQLPIQLWIGHEPYFWMIILLWATCTFAAHSYWL